MSDISAKWVPGSDCNTAWNVFTQTNWAAIGFEKIDNPSFSQLKAGDIFFISARDGLSTGHVGIVASVANGNVVTYEQNVLGAMYVQELPEANSWSWYNSFSGIVRKKADSNNNSNNNNKGEEEMMLLKIVDTTGPHKGKWFISNGTHLRYIRTPRMLSSYQNQYAKMNLKIDNIYSSELFGKKGEFDEKNVIW
ncbi:hypothetical protein C426_1263 [Lactococcus garvieae DCC43]|uniref:Peptidase C51 domain-containing protein n=2 Tax=Lactococcus garvieae TaxID=1363 RepID=K2PMF8_9LACT|nr:hypothetical protein C426_1263 [Lactococcus garvieae DCC43]